jgi:hypothetical protein
VKTQLSKLAAAEAQLERALDLYLSGNDYLAAITLAGAAEEPLGKMVEVQGGKHALQSDASAMGMVHVHLYSEVLPKKRAVAHINRVRDWLKHYGDGSNIEIDPRVEAYDIIDRAVSNYWQLTSRETERMRRFREMGRPVE